MMRWIIHTSLQYRFLVVVIAAALLFFGLSRLRTMPVDVLPEFAPPFVEIQTEALGLSATEVEQLITLNIEELLSGLSWVQTVRSRSVPGLSSVILILEPGTNIMRARQLVQERLTLAHMLPNVSTPPVILQPLSATSRVMMVGMSSKEVSPIEMGVLAHWKIRPALMGVPGVANVAIWGQRERQLQVQVNPERLRAQQVTLDQIVQTAGNALWVSPLSFLNASTPGTGGWIDTPQQRLEVRHILPISSPKDLAQVVVEGSKLRLGDVATVVENHQPLIGDAVLKDGPGLLFVIEKFPAANTLEVTRRVEAVLAELQPGLKGITIDSTVFRPAGFIEVARDNLSSTLLIAGMLIIAVLFAFLYEWRGALIGLVVMATSLLVTVLVLYMRGATLNVMVLAGLMVALAALVDDAIGDVENIAGRLRHNRERDRQTAMAVVLEAALEIRSTLGFATAILVVVALPIFFLQGVSGSFFQPLALSYVLALLVSMAVALTLTPALSLILLGNAPLRRESTLRSWLQRGYDRWLGRIVKAPGSTFVMAGVALLVGLAVLPFFRQQSLLPSFREPQLTVRWEGLPGTSHPAMTQLVTRVSQELRSLPGVTNVAAHVGRAVLADQVVGVNSAQLWISIDPKADYDQTVATIRETVEGYPGLNQEVRSYIHETLRQALTGSNDAIVVRIFGPEFGVLRDKAQQIQQALGKIEGVADLHMDSPVQQSAVEIQVDLARVQRYGLKPGDVRRAAATLMNGLEVGSLFENQKVFQVIVWSTPQTRNSLTAIRELLIDTPAGGHVRLEDVAQVRVAPTLHTINREAISRRIDVGFNVRGRDLGVVTRAVQERIAQIPLPFEYHTVVLGEYAERQAAQQRILITGLVALLGILFLMQALLQSWWLALLGLLSLPVALVGSVLAGFLAGGGVFSIGMLAGLLALLGVAVRGNVMMIHHNQRLEREGLVFGPELVMQGARERLVPILTTSAAVAVAFLPFLLFGNIPGHEFGFPMAIVILGGLVTTTLVNLLVVPALYLRFGASREPDLGLGSAVPSA
ncbi:efflux RND transporter permease subunit [uncultured Meiothermus sp.]|jgi:CzcA family heavy metal efflux pump|uniref:efflux RND transporter permease subunit n=1 Tax=uncultured Meiothermus sp. TaxID=157471 RepID=UPI0026144E85|nr:efflux RND transporter permease subunit [uncultured Meiothermus sp.]